jgi:hypothetical protein
MAVAGSGFVPGDTVEISSGDGSVADSVTADAAGNISLTTGAPSPTFNRPGAKTETVTATDIATTGTITASTPVQVAPLEVQTVPLEAPFTKKVTWYFSGFTPGKHIYAHYLRDKQVARAKFSRAQGPCGVLKARATLYPGGHPHFKKYEVQIDSSKHYNKHATPRIDTRLSTLAF